MREAAMGASSWPSGTLLACYGAALALTLLLAAWLTPRRWWRRPNLAALAVLGGGTLAFGTLIGHLGATPAADAAPRPAAAPLPLARGGADDARVAYRAADALNLRSAPSVRAARVAVLPAGTRVETTGTRDGDWWQVRASIDGRDVAGWSSSLWLRRPGEGAPAPR
jgi:hypothetical protein